MKNKIKYTVLEPASSYERLRLRHPIAFIVAHLIAGFITGLIAGELHLIAGVITGLIAGELL